MLQDKVHLFNLLRGQGLKKACPCLIIQICYLKNHKLRRHGDGSVLRQAPWLRVLLQYPKSLYATNDQSHYIEVFQGGVSSRAIHNLPKKLKKTKITKITKGILGSIRICFLGIFDLPTYPNQILYYISLFSKIRCFLTYLPI
jgi:hypothetical protein